MKRIFTTVHLCLLAITAMLMMSCEKEKLSGVLAKETVANVKLSVENRIDIGSGENFTLNNDELIIPVTINLSGASGTAFNVQVTSNLDTIATLVGSGTLPAGTIALAEQTFNFPPVIDFAYGIKSTTFNLAVSRSFVERNHSKLLALAIKISAPSKGNAIEANKNAVIVVINAAEAIAAEDVHYISFASAGSPYLVPNGTNYEIGTQDLTIPLNLALAGLAGSDFTVDVVPNDALVTALINNGTLKNTVVLSSGSYALTNPKVKFAPNENSAKLELTARISELLKNTKKKVAIGLLLRNPSKFQLDETKKSIVVVIDPDHFRPYNGTPFLIKGAIGAVSDMIPAAQYDFGGEGIAFHDTGGKDGVGDYRPNDNVDVGDYTPRSVVGWTSDGEWLTYTVNVEETGEYELNSLIGAPGDNGRYSVFFDDVNITGILASAKTPGSYGDQQPNRTTVQLTKGRHIMKFYMNVGAYDVRGWIFTRKK
ncbi:DUF1735 domain-containing protein [Pedobacter panaciterrae]|uniref:DUF1735 domain-containing protein n=1 Tax=Pedobacter panaciterrae TaxID=363849 RepID=UPI00155DA148|nr:DUF1735 domain-containing protein [Pedobacter panaciterrae]NQX57060.1 DUF1735 domain-containing protein [Pedobacter panaciterrae]